MYKWGAFEPEVVDFLLRDLAVITFKVFFTTNMQLWSLSLRHFSRNTLIKLNPVSRVFVHSAFYVISSW